MSQQTAWTKCPECGLTHGAHAPNCPADAFMRGRLEAEAEALLCAAAGPLDNAVKAVQQATADAVKLGTGIWQIHYEPRYPDITKSRDPANPISRERDNVKSSYPDSVKQPAPAPAADVTNPGHYRAHPSGVECIAITEHMSFCLGNAVKYIWRADLKHETPLDDLKKARWYLDREIARIEGRA